MTENTNYNTVNYHKDSELNYHLQKWKFRQTKDNREILKGFCEEILKNNGKTFITHQELDDYIRHHNTSHLEKESYDDEDIKPKKSFLSWLLWLILLIVLILIIVFLFRYCSNQKNNLETTTNTALTQQDSSATNTNNGKKTISLDDKQILANPNGLEEQVINFLQSSEYEKATNEDLKDKWFVFDNVNFKFNSVNELTESSDAQLENLVIILNHFKDAKIKIAGYTDKVGSDAVNLRISKQRANFLKQKLIKLGVNAKSIVSTEGYGSKFAKYSETDSDEDRSKDRHMAIRFIK